VISCIILTRNVCSSDVDLLSSPICIGQDLQYSKRPSLRSVDQSYCNFAMAPIQLHCSHVELFIPVGRQALVFKVLGTRKFGEIFKGIIAETSPHVFCALLRHLSNLRGSFLLPNVSLCKVWLDGFCEFPRGELCQMLILVH
jgi:hypothetical protein